MKNGGEVWGRLPRPDGESGCAHRMGIQDLRILICCCCDSFGMVDLLRRSCQDGDPAEVLFF